MPRGTKFGKNQTKNEDFLKNSKNWPPRGCRVETLQKSHLIWKDDAPVQIWLKLEEK